MDGLDPCHPSLVRMAPPILAALLNYGTAVRQWHFLAYYASYASFSACAEINELARENELIAVRVDHPTHTTSNSMPLITLERTLFYQWF